jgi:murein L,D-transpeptidase YcbB/YkuD
MTVMLERGLPICFGNDDARYHYSPRGRMIQRRTRNKIALYAVPLATALVIGLGALRTPATEGTMALEASLGAKKLTVRRDGAVVKQYDVAVGRDGHPTPRGRFNVQKIVWNPAWVPPDAKWARGKAPKDPGHPANPMKLVKIFFKEPDYYIHGTGEVESLGSAASHGWLRMDPDEAGELALMIMENGGQARDWDWVKGILHIGDQRTVSLATSTPMTITP